MRRFGLFSIHLQSKNKATLGNASNSNPKDSVTQEITVWRKRRLTSEWDSLAMPFRWINFRHDKLVNKTWHFWWERFLPLSSESLGLCLASRSAISNRYCLLNQKSCHYLQPRPHIEWHLMTAALWMTYFYLSKLNLVLANVLKAFQS